MQVHVKSSHSQLQVGRLATSADDAPTSVMEKEDLDDGAGPTEPLCSQYLDNES